MTIGEKIYKYRKQEGLSQEELADKMNVTRQSVSLWETDQTVPSLDSLMMLADLFSVSMDELCGTAVKEGERGQSGVKNEQEQTEANEETEQSCQPEKSKSLASVQTRYTEELVYSIFKLTSRTRLIWSIVALIVSVHVGLIMITEKAKYDYFIIPIILVAASVAVLVTVCVLRKRRAEEFLRLYPNSVVNVELFKDRLELHVTSDNSDSKSTVLYSNIKQVRNTEKYILIYYGNSIAPIEKNLPDTNYYLINNLLKMHAGGNDKPHNEHIKSLLVAMFVLSIVSIFMALIIVFLCEIFSPIPDFPFSMPEFMWIFLLFIPIPLASAILGIIFLTKKYKCKKNIIAGFIMSGLLAIYGSFTFAFVSSDIHDFGYVGELEQTIAIELPDSGYLSQAKNVDSTTKSVAMIKFDDKKEMYGIASSDERFVTDTDFMPLNFISAVYVSIVSGYEYFMLFDVTDNTAIVSKDYEYGKEHRYIFLAYDKEKNILFVLDFIK